jgi:hypothetical protein
LILDYQDGEVDFEYKDDSDRMVLSTIKSESIDACKETQLE